MSPITSHLRGLMVNPSDIDPEVLKLAQQALAQLRREDSDPRYEELAVYWADALLLAAQQLDLPQLMRVPKLNGSGSDRRYGLEDTRPHRGFSLVPRYTEGVIVRAFVPPAKKGRLGWGRSTPWHVYAVEPKSTESTITESIPTELIFKANKRESHYHDRTGLEGLRLLALHALSSSL